MRERRDANRKRLKKGLADNNDPSPTGQWTQGSYAMRTMIQETGSKYDIDDGVYFSRDSLKGTQGAEKTAIAARNMVRDAIDDGTFTRAPKVKKNCVRVYYSPGYHVDIPVYRTWEEEGLFGEVIERLQLASADWKDSDPLKVTEWFNNAMKELSPPDDNTQFRRIVRLHKKFSNSRESWRDKTPSGFTVSKLCQEEYVPASGDDEKSLHLTMKAIKARLDFDLSVAHPVVSEELAGDNDPKTEFLRQKLVENLKHLEILDDPNCTKKDALAAWAKVFNDEFFEELADKEESSSSKNSAGVAALSVGLLADDAGAEAVQKSGGGRFG